jgi:hypothetical protein
MFELFAGSEAVRRKVGAATRPVAPKAAAPRVVTTRRRRRAVAVRTVSAAALRNLAERLEPAPTQ